MQVTCECMNTSLQSVDAVVQTSVACRSYDPKLCSNMANMLVFVMSLFPCSSMRPESMLYRTVQAERAVRGEHEQHCCVRMLMKMLMQMIGMASNMLVLGPTLSATQHGFSAFSKHCWRNFLYKTCSRHRGTAGHHLNHHIA